MPKRVSPPGFAFTQSRRPKCTTRAKDAALQIAKVCPEIPRHPRCHLQSLQRPAPPDFPPDASPISHLSHGGMAGNNNGRSTNAIGESLSPAAIKLTVPVGLDGSAELAAMARAKTDCEVLHQDFLVLDLPSARFDGIFANASLFHVPSSQLARVLGDLAATLKPSGVLFCSNPRGDNEEGWAGGRYGCFHDLQTWRAYVTAAGFLELHHYYRPPGRPRAQQPWLATVWRKSSVNHAQ